VKIAVLVVIEYLQRRESPVPDFEYSHDDVSRDMPIISKKILQNIIWWQG